MSPYAWLAAVVIAAVTLGGTHWKVYTMGEQAVQGKWDKSNLDAERSASKEQLRKQEIIDASAAKYAAKAHSARQIVKANTAKEEQYVPTINSPMLSGGFRLYHDAAATGTALDDSGGLDAPPVSASDVAKTVRDNYAECLDDKERLAGLQEVIKVVTEGGQ